MQAEPNPEAMLIFSGCPEGECPLRGAMCWADPAGTAEAGELARPPQEEHSQYLLREVLPLSFLTPLSSQNNKSPQLNKGHGLGFVFLLGFKSQEIQALLCLLLFSVLSCLLPEGLLWGELGFPEHLSPQAP